jgi:hypothetical protein
VTLNVLSPLSDGTQFSLEQLGRDESGCGDLKITISAGNRPIFFRVAGGTASASFVGFIEIKNLYGVQLGTDGGSIFRLYPPERVMPQAPYAAQTRACFAGADPENTDTSLHPRVEIDVHSFNGPPYVLTARFDVVGPDSGWLQESMVPNH